MKIVAADIGGTHARFAIAELMPGVRPRIGEMRKYRTREAAGLADVWGKFARDTGGALPRAAAIAVAAPIEGDTLTFMNSDWRIARFGIADEIGLDRLTLLNDFGAVAHAVSVMGADEFMPLCGPDDLPADGVTTVLGPGTGLGVAILDRRRSTRSGQGGVTVIETEASHIGFCPLDPEEEELSDALTALYGRASIERVVSGPGLIDIYRFLGGGDWDPHQAGALWDAAIGGGDPVAEKALAIMVRCFGAAAGDIALAQGSMGVAVTGGLAGRIVHLLKSPAFEARFTAKGRYRARMLRTPVRLLTEPEPGLLGAAVAFEREWGLSAAPS
jgi:glucokinase